MKPAGPQRSIDQSRTAAPDVIGPALCSRPVFCSEGTLSDMCLGGSGMHPKVVLVSLGRESLQGPLYQVPHYSEPSCVSVTRNDLSGHYTP